MVCTYLGVTSAGSVQRVDHVRQGPARRAGRAAARPAHTAQHPGAGGGVCEGKSALGIASHACRFLLKCKTFNLTTSKHEMTIIFEVCKISRMDITGVKLKRVKGDTWQYKKACAYASI